MNIRYPLIRFEIYEKHEDAVTAFKEAKKLALQDGNRFTTSNTSLTLEDRYIRTYFMDYSETKIRGCQIDKAVFHFGPSPEELDLVKSCIKPNTTVEKPVTIEMLP